MNAGASSHLLFDETSTGASSPTPQAVPTVDPMGPAAVAQSMALVPYVPSAELLAPPGTQLHADHTVAQSWELANGGSVHGASIAKMQRELAALATRDEPALGALEDDGVVCAPAQAHFWNEYTAQWDPVDVTIPMDTPVSFVEAYDGFTAIKLGTMDVTVPSDTVDWDDYVATEAPVVGSEPKIDDIKQGPIGDCYLMAALGAVVERDPKYVKSLVTDHGDAVSVRLFRPAGEGEARTFTPEFIKVWKSTLKRKPNGATEDRAAKGALWVQMIEKAYVAGGFSGNQRKTEDLGGGPSSYAEVGGGGHGAYALEVLLGRAAERTGIQNSEAAATSAARKASVTRPWGALERSMIQLGKSGMKWSRKHNIDMSADEHYANSVAYGIFEDVAQTDKWGAWLGGEPIEKMIAQRTEVRLGDFLTLFEEAGVDPDGKMGTWLSDSNLYPGARGTGIYSSAQLALFTKIKAAHADGAHIVVGSRKEVSSTKSDQKGTSGEPLAKGLAGKHAYTVLDVAEGTGKNPDDRDADGPHNWVKLRNPWGNMGRKYSGATLKASADEDSDGNFWLELADLGKRFSHVDIG